MGYRKQTLRNMSKRQREVAELQMKLESAVKASKKIVETIQDLEEAASREIGGGMPTRGSYSKAMRFIRGEAVNATPPCPDLHFCWACGEKGYFATELKEEELFPPEDDKSILLNHMEVR